jgi:hypothetical protein
MTDALLGALPNYISLIEDIIYDVDHGLMPELPESLKPQALGIRAVAGNVAAGLRAHLENLQ